MQCVTPMFFTYKLGDKKHGKIVSRSDVMQGLELTENNIRIQTNNYEQRNNKKCITVPCRKCWACQLNYSAEWATRIMLEAQKYESNWFITLTYDDDHLPILEELQTTEHWEDISGNVETMDVTYKNDGTQADGTLLPEHMDTFINTLRKKFERKGHNGIKYFYAGEYGENTRRPHYHIILLNCPLDINLFYNTHVDSNFKIHWKSKEIDEIWKKGMIDVAELEWSCAAYVARYCTKKISFNSDKREYYSQLKLPEYTRSSHRMGMDYFEQHMDEIYKTDEMIMKTVKGNTGSFKPPKAFDKKFKELRPKEWRKIQRSRAKAAERSRKLQEEITDYTDLEMLKIKADRLQTKMQMLPRVGEW